MKKINCLTNSSSCMQFVHKFCVIFSQSCTNFVRALCQLCVTFPQMYSHYLAASLKGMQTSLNDMNHWIYANAAQISTQCGPAMWTCCYAKQAPLAQIAGGHWCAIQWDTRPGHHGKMAGPPVHTQRQAKLPRIPLENPIILFRSEEIYPVSVLVVSLPWPRKMGKNSALRSEQLPNWESSKKTPTD